MNAQEAWRRAADELRAAGTDDAALEAQLLLAHALGLTRTRLLSSYAAITDEQAESYRRLIERRLRHEPTAYITGCREFYDLTLECTPAAPVPRPETEIVVEEALAATYERKPLTIVDVGTGSGAIALALAKHLPEARIVATDIAADALALAMRNAASNGLAGRVDFVRCDLIAPFKGPFDLILANLPYVKTGDWEGLAPEIRLHEPRRAFDGGADGLRRIAELLATAEGRLAPDGVIVLEIGWDEGEALRSISRNLLPQAAVSIKRDLAGLDRIAILASDSKRIKS